MRSPPARERLRSEDREGGFTLLEILIAIAILGVALVATSRAAHVATDGALESRQRLLATWAAQNRIAELRARRVLPATASSHFDATQAGLALGLDETVSETPNPAIRRVDVAVSLRDSSRVVARLTAYVSR